MLILGSAASGGKKPGTPTIGTATGGNASATVAFTAPTYLGKGGTVTYTATSSPGGFTGTSTTSPITVSGLTNGTSYTFVVKATTSYGVASADSAASNAVTPAQPFTATGGTTSTPGDGYKYHTFTGGGSFTVTAGSQPAAFVVVVAGGGGGGTMPSYGSSGGGGGGGVVYAPIAFTPVGGNGAGVYTVAIGAGGAPSVGNPLTNGQGFPGNNSTFTSLTTSVGGGGGAGSPSYPGGDPNQLGRPGGSGGGGSNNSVPIPGTLGSGTPGQGFPGGAPLTPTDNNAGGGGGGGGRSIDKTVAPAPFIAAGLPSLNESMGGVGALYFGTYYGGGGGGSVNVPRPLGPSYPSIGPVYGAGGAGGGGHGLSGRPTPNPLGGPVSLENPVAGTANTGGGGGGGGSTANNGALAGSGGGSGIVVVRYPV
jgi:hypothetical protein